MPGKYGAFIGSSQYKPIMSGILGNIVSITLHVCLLVSFSLAVEYQYECICKCQPEDQEQCHMQVSHTVFFDEDIGKSCDYCLRYGSGVTDDCPSSSFQYCCWSDLVPPRTLKCEHDPEHRCNSYSKECTPPLPRPSNCTCTTVELESVSHGLSTLISNGLQTSATDISSSTTDQDVKHARNIYGSSEEEDDSLKEDSSIFGIGIGVGVGLSVLIAALFALLVYCRIQGRREGRRESQQKIISSRKSKGESEIYSEIDENVIQAGGRSTHAAVNPGYNTSDEVIGPTKNNVYLGLNKEDATTINHQYKSLKKPNQDLGSGDYADPEKYTEPPVLPYRNSNAIDNEYVCDEEDYVSQGTPEPARNDEGDDDEEEDIDDYVDHGTPSSIRVKMETHSPSEELTSASEPFSHETGAIVAKASDQEHNNSDYITGVDNIADPNVDSEEVIEQVESDYIDM